MDTDERDLFHSERKRLKRTQTAVARKSGVGQGLISQIEIDPNYNPTVAVFKKAVTGIDHTLSSFYTRIEGLNTAAPSAENPRLPSPLKAVGDDTLPAFESEERIAERVFRRLARFALEGGPRERPTHHRLPAEARPLAAESSAPPRTPRRRNVPRKAKKRPPKK